MSATTGGPDKAPPPVLVRGPDGSRAVPAGAATGITLSPPEHPLMVSVPHSGRHYPDSMTRASVLSLHELRMSEDAYVDRLTEGVAALGLTQVVATHARSYVDLNRTPRELDPDMFTPRLAGSAVDDTLRVRAGLGVVPAMVGPGRPIYAHPLPAPEAEARINAVYTPYHATLRAHLDARHKRFREAILLDVHSMPALPGSPTERPWPEIVLGDCWGASCSRDLTSLAEQTLVRAGFSVRRNVPYAGGFACQHYGLPQQGIQVLQIEINRSLYMDEETLTPHPHFTDVRDRLTDVITTLARHHGRSRQAAE